MSTPAKSTQYYPLIAFAGYAGSGKDAAARALINIGYKRHAFGDIIKRQVDELVTHTFGFSAFTEVRDEKEMIRRTLEAWGEDNYKAVFNEYFATLPTPCVNPRLCRIPEAEEWKRRGGIIIYIQRLGGYAETPWAEACITDLFDKGYITRTLYNDGSEADLQNTLFDLYGGQIGCTRPQPAEVVKPVCKLDYASILKRANELYVGAKLQDPSMHWGQVGDGERPTIKSDQVKSAIRAVVEALNAAK